MEISACNRQVNFNTICFLGVLLGVSYALIKFHRVYDLVMLL